MEGSCTSRDARCWCVLDMTLSNCETFLTLTSLLQQYQRQLLHPTSCHSQPLVPPAPFSIQKHKGRRSSLVTTTPAPRPGKGDNLKETPSRVPHPCRRHGLPVTLRLPPSPPRLTCTPPISCPPRICKGERGLGHSLCPLHSPTRTTS